MTQTGITTKQKGKRIEVESEKLKLVKNARYNRPYNDRLYSLFKSFGELYKKTMKDLTIRPQNMRIIIPTTWLKKPFNEWISNIHEEVKRNKIKNKSSNNFYIKSNNDGFSCRRWSMLYHNGFSYVGCKIYGFRNR